MPRESRPNVEGLEDKSLLSGLSSSLTTDKPAYEVGQTITMTFTETNASNEAVTTGDGPSIDGFYVTHDGTTVWASNEGMEPMYIVDRTLAPGQSITLSATWNGIQNEGTPVSADGEFVVHNQLAPAGPTAAFTLSDGSTPSSPAPTQPPAAPAPLHPASPLLTTLQTGHTTYHRGQAVNVKLVETNAGANDLAVSGGRHVVNFQVSRDGVVVWQTPDGDLHSTGRQTLPAGHSRAFSLVWNGKPNVPHAKIVAGTYSVTGTVDGIAVTTLIHLV